MEKAKRLRNILALSLCFVIYYGIIKYTGKGIPCLFRYIFHLQCPGCGITHMFLALAKGDLREAYQSNPVILCFSPFLGWILIKSIRNYINCTKTIWNKWENSGMMLLLAALIVFGVIRNLL